MNISVAMQILKARDIDHTAKCALLMLACYADRGTATATVSMEHLAADLDLSYEATRRGIARAIKAGYLQVVGPSRPGQVRTLRFSRTTQTTYDVRLSAPNRTPQTSYLKRRDREVLEAPPPVPREATNGGPVDKPVVVSVPNDGLARLHGIKRHPGSCACAGSGWLDAGDGTVTRCSKVTR